MPNVCVTGQLSSIVTAVESEQNIDGEAKEIYLIFTTSRHDLGVPSRSRSIEANETGFGSHF